MIPSLYMKSGCLAKHPFKIGSLGFQVNMMIRCLSNCVSRPLWMPFLFGQAWRDYTAPLEYLLLKFFLGDDPSIFRKTTCD